MALVRLRDSCNMNRMGTQSQDPFVEDSGRVNQKRRTRAAIVAAARAILDRGETPTVAQVAEEAQMTRTTVYRYFPNQEALLVELSVSLGVDDDFAELLARPLDGTSLLRRACSRSSTNSTATSPPTRSSTGPHSGTTSTRGSRPNAQANTMAVKCEKDVDCAGSQPRWHRYATPCLTPTYDASKAPSALSPAARRSPSCATSAGSKPTKPSPSPTGRPKRC